MRAGKLKRVSTQEQKLGFSLSAQDEKLNAFAKYQGYDIVADYNDDGYSGTTLNRPGMQQLISDVKAKKIDVILIYKLDRLSRKVKDILELLDLFEKYGVKLISVTENLDVTSSFGRAALKMSATFSELERELIVERSIMGRDERAKKGLYTGKAPFGWVRNYETKLFEIKEDEYSILCNLLDLYLTGEYSIRDLSQYAHDKYNHPYFNNSMACKKLLKNPMVCGYFYYKGELIKGQNFNGDYPLEKWLLVQKQIEKNKSSRKCTASPYLLTGLVYCEQCGNRYVGKKYRVTNTLAKGRKKEYKREAYGCSARLKRDKNYTPVACKNKIYPAEKLNSIILDRVKNLKFQEFTEPSFQLTGIVDKLMSENIDIKKQLEKLLDLYLGEMINKETYQDRSYKLETRLQKNNEIIQKESQPREFHPNVGIDFLKERLDRIDEADQAEKRQLLTYLIKQITIDNDNINITWRVK